MSNKLKNETSPYLLQHAENPVNWYPWCEEAFEKAREENKPVFLSIGYSTCHWCHVMAHESFEDIKTADILNEHFVSIKVDREERPDIDSVYMAVCQALTGGGGWPMSIFMTWDKKPFFAGTYFPRNSRYGMPAFLELLNTIAKQWSLNHTELLKSAEGIIEHMKNTESVQGSEKPGSPAEKAIQIFTRSFDSLYGGFGSAPKFPMPHNLLFLMLYAKQTNNPDILKMAEKTLIQIRKGGIFDHIGYGFSRYSTDDYYLVPHFEKMLYDNALLIMAYVSAYKMTDKNIYLDTAEKTAEYILNEMTSPDGGFYSAQDADSEGVEGRYYTFSLNEITDILGDGRGYSFAEAFDITREGNFEGTNIPNLLRSNDLNIGFEAEIKKLYDYRKNRFRLHLDDKILLSWNSMMAAAMSFLYRASYNERYLKAAQRSLNFIEKNLCEGMQLFNSFHSGRHSKQAFLDDYAFYTAALIEMYDSTLNSVYIEKAESFSDEAVRRFADRKKGGFYLCNADNDELFMNPKEVYDGAIPSGNSVMAYNFVRMYQLTEKEEYRKLAEGQLAYMTSRAQEYPAGHTMLLIAMLMHENPPERITVAVKACPDSVRLRKELPFLANISVVADSTEYPLLDGQTTYYVCKNHTCLPPTNSPKFRKSI
ncbi:MAG: thioredoxin domain-containing protein [Clostridia bacterium]|nr:thioredoxin domain-containing protein [Clostridia bacterium]